MTPSPSIRGNMPDAGRYRYRFGEEGIFPTSDSIGMQRELARMSGPVTRRPPAMISCAASRICSGRPESRKAVSPAG
jgi:hypothetical protein